jgi:hypothetical protein
MIKEVDLRIGNWVEIPGKGFTQINSGEHIDLVARQGAKPIAITEEILSSVGFIKRGDSEIYDLKGKNFAYHLGIKRVTIYHPGNHLWHWLGCPIASVHQIQNLFYCLAGYDLTFQI